MTGISLITRLISFSGTATGLALTGLSVVGIPMAVFRVGWQITASALDYRWPSIWAPSWLEVPWSSTGLVWRGSPMQPPPSWDSLLVPIIEVAAGLAIWLLLMHAFLPMGLRLRKMLNVQVTPCTAVDPCQHWINQLHRDYRGPRSQVWIASFQGIQAFAISGPFGQHAIVISQDLYARAHPDICRWVLAHEYGHILHGDTRSRTLWLLTMRSLTLLDLSRRVASRLGLLFLLEVPLLRLVVVPAALALRAIERLVSIGKWVGVRWFLLFDAWASRRMEFAADHFATLAVGPRPGVTLFQNLRGDLEPRFNGLFASHPTFRARIRHIHKVTKGSLG